MDFDYCPDLARLMCAGSIIGASGRVYNNAALGSRSTANNLKVIRAYMLRHKPQRTLEIGFAFGASALAFTASHRELGGTHVAIDPYQLTWWDSAGLLALERAALLDHLEFRDGESCVELPRMLDEEREFDFIYVDGSHLFEDVFVDAHYCIRMLSQGGVVAFDDSANPHVAKVLRFIRRTVKGLEEIDLSAYRASDWRYRLARLAGRVQMTGFRRSGPVARSHDSRYVPF